MVVDVENIFIRMHREEDDDTKRIYYHLFKVCLKIFEYVHSTKFIAVHINYWNY